MKNYNIQHMHTLLNQARTYTFFYEQVNKIDGSVRHVNLGNNSVKAPKQTHQWHTMKLLEERCRKETPWLVRMIGAMPVEMYERRKFANYDQEVYLEHYDTSN